MTILNILSEPHPNLRKKSRDVNVIDQSIHQLVSNMIDTMYDANGVGLAAPQVNVRRRIITIDLGDLDDTNNVQEDNPFPLCMINPRIVMTSADTIEMNEGCLSVPGVYLPVTRPANISVEYINIYGVPISLEAGGWLARVIQHEIDHLDGKLMIDYGAL